MKKTCLLVLAAVAMLAMPLAVSANAPLAGAAKTVSGDQSAFAEGRILVKFTPNAYASSKLNFRMEKGLSAPGIETGLASVDALSFNSGVTKVSRPYGQPADVELASSIGVDRWFALEIPAGSDPRMVAARYAADPNVESATVDWRAFPAATPNDTYYDKNWGHENTGQLLAYDWATYSHENGDPVGTPGFDTKAYQAWDAAAGFGDPGVVIAIIDSGVDVNHPDLRLVPGYDFGDNDSNPMDDSADPGHGTCCAGVAAARADNNIGVAGAAGGCSVMPVKIADSGGSMYFSYIQNALYYVGDQDVDIASMSLGAPLSSDPATDDAIAYAYNKGVTILAATGNENMSTISYPAINQYVIGVGAASPCGDRKRSSSSSTELNPGVDADPLGYTCDGERWWGSNYGVSVQDAAGAVDVLAPTILPSTDISGSGGYVSGDYEMWFNGTSCSTPYAAGVCALIVSNSPGLTPAQVRDALVSTATDVVNAESGTGWDRWSGYGMVDAAAAVGGGEPVAPTAAFSGVPVSGYAPLSVSFNDQSSGIPTSWNWNFGDGATSTAQNPTHVYDTVGTYTVTLTAANDVGSDAEVKSAYITVLDPGSVTDVTATGETSVIGTVSGSYLNTKFADNSYEVLTEEAYTGHPRKTYSYMEHRWNFDLPANGGATFTVEAYRPANSDGDNFVFTYSTDGSTWLPLVTVASATEQAYTAEISVQGAVTVRVVDSNRTYYMTSNDKLYVDYVGFTVGGVVATPPTAAFSGSPVSGVYPLEVAFADESTGSPTTWNWDFGDGGNSTAQNPAHTYTAAGVYTVSLTVGNDEGADSLTRTDYITVTEPGTQTAVHVAAISVSRAKVGPNYLGVGVITIQDENGLPISGATVFATATGPSGGSFSGVTGTSGTVTMQTSGIKKPSGEWCFEVTNVTHATLTYDSAANVVTKACESGTVYSADAKPASFSLSQNHPNPFNPMTQINFGLQQASSVRLCVYNVRGEVVAVLAEGPMSSGEHTVTWYAGSQPSGVYFYRLDAGAFSEVKRMMLLK